MEGEFRRTAGLPVNLTSVDISGVLRGTDEEGFVGAQGSIRSHFAKNKLAFIRGAIGHSWEGGRSGLEWEALAGLRMKF